MLFTAYTDLKEVMKSAKLFSQQFDFSKVSSDPKEVAMIQRLVNAGKIDIGVNTELGKIRVEGEGVFTDTWNKVDTGLRLMVQKVEALNRLSTALASYRLQLEKTGNAEKAYQYAAMILDDTHGDYTPFAAPRAFNTNVGKVALQFRKFQLIQLGLIAKLTKQAFTGDERWVAAKALTFLLANTAVMAGVRGLPGYAAIAWALGALLGDEDEPYDLDRELRKALGDGDMANMILRGAPTLAGVDLSGKIGMGNTLSVMPFTEIDQLSGTKTYEIVGTRTGDILRGSELVLPKGVGDAMKAYRINQEGVTNRRGDVLLPASEVSAVESFYQALGLQPVDQAVRSEKQGQLIKLEQKFKDRSTQLKKEYTKAFRNGDKEAMKEARDGWMKLQTSRTTEGFTRRPLSDLLKAPRDQAKRERDTEGGIQYNRSNRRFVESLTD